MHSPVKYILFLLLLVQNFILSAQEESYALSVPQKFPSNIQDDYLHLLETSTRKKWKAVSSPKDVKQGFILAIDDQPSFTTKETYRLQSNGTNILTIWSSSNEGLIFGLYKHLRTLDLKFYLPDELYTVVPFVTNPFGKKKDIIDKPFLQIRNFVGTGGFGTANPDTDKSVEKDWLLWKLRNGFGSAYHLSGHRGENFILENKNKLLQNPKWLVKPVSNTPDITTKLNYLNTEAVDFFTDWTIRDFLNPSYKTPPPGHTDLLSIEPADGGGYLNDYPETIKKNLPSISDQVYGAANLAAKKLDKLFPKNPNIGVNLYAYSTHAEPPSFPLHPRVFVQLVPYQFQNIAYGPSFIQLWSAKTKRFGLYDYFKYTDAQFDVPGGLTLQETMNRLVQSVKAGSEGTTYETSYSKFSTGIPLWVIGRYMADGDADWQKNISVFAADLYQSAKEPIHALLNLFYNNANFNVNQLGNAVGWVDEASRNSKNKLVIERVNELKKYLYFTHLVYQSRNEQKGSLKERLLPVTEYAWKLFESKIIHSYRVMALVSYAFLNTDRAIKDYNVYQQLHLDWFPETKRSIAAWDHFSQELPVPQIEKDFSLLKKMYSRTTPAPAYTFADIEKGMAKLYKSKTRFITGGDAGARGYFGIYSQQGTELVVQYALSSSTVAPKAVISTVDPSYAHANAFTLVKSSGEIKISLPAGETSFFIHAAAGTTYRLEVKLQNGLVFFDGSPRGIMNFYKKMADPVGAASYDPEIFPSYVYIPNRISLIDYKTQLNTLNIFTPDGKKIASTLMQSEHGGIEFRQFKIDPSFSGKLLKAVVTGNYNHSFLNIPDRYFLLEKK